MGAVHILEINHACNQISSHNKILPLSKDVYFSTHRILHFLIQLSSIVDIVGTHGWSRDQMFISCTDDIPSSTSYIQTTGYIQLVILLSNDWAILSPESRSAVVWWDGNQVGWYHSSDSADHNWLSVMAVIHNTSVDDLPLLEGSMPSLWCGLSCWLTWVEKLL